MGTHRINGPLFLKDNQLMYVQQTPHPFVFQVANRRTPVCILPTTLCYYSYSKDVNSTLREMYGDKFSHRLRLTHSSNHNLYDYYLQGNLKQKFTTQITIQLNWREKVRTKVIAVSQEFQSHKCELLYRNIRNTCRMENISSICFKVSSFF